MTEDLKKKQVLCNGCNSFVYLLGDYAKTICNDHVHCFNCLKRSLETKLCQCCHNELSPEQENNIVSHIYEKCEICQTDQLRIYFVPKQCCKIQVCGRCQAPNTACNICKTELDPPALFFIEKFALYKRKIESKNSN